ncbi:MAG: hypothetical protein WAN23_15555 [Candidatus Acidiferrales bacterium]
MAPKSKRPSKPSRPAPKAKTTPATPALPPPKLTQPGVGAGNPQFGESKYTPDPTQYLHAVTDNMYYKQVDKETVNQLIQTIPPPRDPKNLLLSLAEVYGTHGSSKVAEINSAKQVNQEQLRIEYHDATTGLNSKSPSDVVTVDLASHTLVV